MDTPLHIDWTTIVGLLALGQAAFLCVYLVIFHPKKQASWLILGLMLSIIIALGHDVLLHSKLALLLPQIIGFGPFSTYLSGPLILLVAVKLLWPDRQFKPYDSLHFLPFVLHFFSRLSHYCRATDDKLVFLQRYYASAQETATPIPLSLDALSGMVLFYGHRFIYLGVAIYLLFHFKSRLDHALPGRVQFARVLLYSLITYSFGWLILRAAKFMTPLQIDLTIHSLALTVAVLLLALCLFRFSLDDIFSNKSTQKYQQSPMDDDLTKQIVKQLNDLLIEDQLFCDNDLKQTTVSEKLGLSTQMISQALNSQGISFNDFINQYRLAHVREQLTKIENAKADIQQLALDSGFNSKATFYRVFKEKVGMTPSQFRKESRQNHNSKI